MIIQFQTVKLATAIITPFTLSAYDGKSIVDYNALEKLLTTQMDHANQIVIMGSTGEGHALTSDERIGIATKVIKIRDEFLLKYKKKIDIICGISSNITNIALEQVIQLEKTGVDGFMIATPYYNKPTPAGIYDFFSQIATATSLPIMLYDIASRACIQMPFDIVKKLSQNHNNIKSLKLSTNDLSRINDAFFHLRNDIEIYCGDDESILAFGALNAHGIVSVTSNLYVTEMKDLCNFIKERNFIKALDLFKEIQSKIRQIFYTTNPIGIKKHLSKKYEFIENICRSPLIADNENLDT